MILAGDIGGTKCNLAVFEEHGSSFQLLLSAATPRGNLPALRNLIERFFHECAAETGVTLEDEIDAAGFGVAGTVVDGRLVANNIPWELTASGLATS